MTVNTGHDCTSPRKYYTDYSPVNEVDSLTLIAGQHLVDLE